ncbi:hypothetical protein RD792_004853 [Penstemon davidsonii]|uniref:Peptidase metallopeptidase domain-containing protein n=1 Tax=Penstemon davidsonii TaxID=160366 RepID=A0ABR0DJ15_9LAMI|nr:hypothetical protein RD792_004853 [Penstemon davidsonii]
MQEPRCGIPDLFNTNESTFHMVSHYSFFRGRSRWRKRSLKYSFNINVKEEAKPPLERALKEWANATPFRFFHVKQSSKAHIRISFLHGDHGDGLPFGTIKGGLAHAFGPNDGRVHFDADEKWASNGDKNAYDIQFVGLHELGHILGLGHSRIEKAVMYPIVDLGERKHLHEDDINGVKALYKF